MTKKRNYHVYATVVDGMTVILDPIAYTFIKVLNKGKCKETYDNQIKKIECFKNHIFKNKFDLSDVVIVIINVDSPYGPEIARVLALTGNWQECRDKRETPFAKGLAMKGGMIEMIEVFDEEASKKINQIKDIPVVIIDHGIVEVFSA